MDDLKLASDVKFPTKEDGYAWNQNMCDIQNNYIGQIKSFNFWKVTGINGQLWIAGYTGIKLILSDSNRRTGVKEPQSSFLSFDGFLTV